MAVNSYIGANGITLEQMLEARDRRAERQKELIAEYNLPLISLTVNMPGPYKSLPVCSEIFRAGLSELFVRLKGNGEKGESEKPVIYQEAMELLTGPEAFVVVDADSNSLKELVIEIENLHPLGRLLDFDVIDRNGRSVSRDDLGYPRRKCLLCEQDAHACARSRAHSLDDLMAKIQSIAELYFMNKEQGRMD